MTTRGTMLAEMADDMERSDTDAFTSKINAAIRQYQPKRFFFNEGRNTTFNTVASTDFYAWAAIGVEFYTVDGVFVTDTGGNVLEVRSCDYRELELLADASASENLPTLYAYIAGGLRFYPAPDQAYSVRITGHLKIAAPEADDEAYNPWMTEAYDLIMSRAKAELYAHRYGDPSMAAVMQAAEESALDRLNRASAKKMGTGQFVPTQF